MVKIKKCSECQCVMKCTAWHFEEDTGDKQGTGDFDCRNCDNLVNNEVDGVISISGYSSALFDGVPDEKQFDEFVDEHTEDD